MFPLLYLYKQCIRCTQNTTTMSFINVVILCLYIYKHVLLCNFIEMMSCKDLCVELLFSIVCGCTSDGLKFTPVHDSDHSLLHAFQDTM